MAASRASADTSSYRDRAREAVEAARQEVSLVVRALRADWRADPAVGNAFETLRDSRQAYEQELRRVIKKLEADSDIYTRLQAKASALRDRLEKERREAAKQREADKPSLVEDGPKVDSGGMVPADLGPSDKTVPAGVPAELTEAQLDKLLAEQNSTEPGFDPISAEQAERAQDMLDIQTQLAALEREAMQEDDAARAALEQYQAAVAELDQHQATLKATILNDPEYQAAIERLNRAQVRAAGASGR
ncbi:MAG: hypothetical protein AAGK78_11935 [Planctomycetota bacterium]